MKFCRTKFFAAIWFFALFLNVFSIALFAETPRNPADTVYCPLSKKFQPVKAQKEDLRQNPLENICAVETEKKSFADALLGGNLLKTNTLDEKQFENLVFDFFQKGKTAFATLPQFPDLPHKNSLENSSSSAIFGKTSETQIIWKTTAEKFNFAQNPRPPNDISAITFTSRNISELKKISRRISPRAPPFSL